MHFLRLVPTLMLQRVLPLLILTACSSSPPPAPAPEPVAPPFEFPHPSVWTTRPGVEIRIDTVLAADIPRPFSRLDVIAADSTGAEVRCVPCGEPLQGRVAWSDLVYEAGTPAAAAHGTIAEFALAIRDAAQRRDLEALRSVMARDFTYALIGPPGREMALAAWAAEGFLALDLVPQLLDRGLATRDGNLWAAPAEHLEELGYQGYRLGFRASPDGRWEWIFLIRGER
jgi:hypothetical protein